MSEDGQQAAQPTMICTLELDPALKSILDPAHPFRAAMSRALVNDLANLMKMLGIPGQPSVELHVLEEAVPHFMNVQINSQLCPYQIYIYRRIYAYVKGSLAEIETDYETMWAWLRDSARALSEAPERESLDLHPLIEFLTCACLEIVKMRPAVLLNLDQAEAIKQVLLPFAPPAEGPAQEAEKDAWPQTAWLHGILTRILQQNISLADTYTIGLTLFTMRASSQDEIAEELIAKLSANVLEIHLPQDLLRTFTTAYARYLHGHLRNVRQTMMQSLGLSLPDMRFVLNEELKPGNFACKINNLLLLSWPVAPEDALDYMEPLLLQNVRENRKCFVHRRVVAQWLASYTQFSPLLFRLSSARLSLSHITQVLRILIIEEVQIRDLAFIIEHLLNYNAIVADPALPMRFEWLFPVPPEEESPQFNHPSKLASFVRIGLKRAITYKYAGEQRRLSCYVLQGEPAVEQALAVFHEYQSQKQPDSTDTQQAVITSIGVRPAVQELINAGILPSIPVLAYQELVPGLQIQLLDKIAVGTPPANPPVSQENT